MPFLCALSISSSSKQMRIHSRAGTNSAPRSAMRPTRSMQFSCTFSCLFFRIGVSRGSRSLMGGVIFGIPITFTMACVQSDTTVSGCCVGDFWEMS